VLVQRKRNESEVGRYPGRSKCRFGMARGTMTCGAAANLRGYGGSPPLAGIAANSSALIRSAT
jgi:hypothetical protein